MKKFARGASLILAAVLSLGIFAACDEEKIQTIDEIYQTLNQSQNAKATMNLEMEGSMAGVDISAKITSDMEVDVNQVHMLMGMTMELMGGEVSYDTEAYATSDETSTTVYMKNPVSGEWISESMDLAEAGMDLSESVSQYQGLFDSKYYGEYDKETKRYTMTEGSKITMDAPGIMDSFSQLGLGDFSFSFSDAYIELGDNSYTVFAKYAVGEALSGTLTMTYSDIGKVSVTIPEEVTK